MIHVECSEVVQSSRELDVRFWMKGKLWSAHLPLELNFLTKVSHALGFRSTSTYVQNSNNFAYYYSR